MYIRYLLGTVGSKGSDWFVVLDFLSFTEVGLRERRLRMTLSIQRIGSASKDAKMLK